MRQTPAYTHVSTSGGFVYEKAAYREYCAADRGVAADALHWHGVPGLAGRAHRGGRHRAVPVGHERRGTGHDLCDKRHPLRGHAARGGGDRAWARLGRRRGNVQMCRVQPHIRRGSLRDTVHIRGADRFSLDRRREDGHEPQDTVLWAAVHCAVVGAVRLFHGLRADMETLAGAFARAAHMRRTGGHLPQQSA